MTRRRLVALVSVCVLLVIGLVAVSTVLFITRTHRGRETVRELIAQKAASALKPGGGKAYIGHVTGSFINGVTLDSLELRDKRGEIFLATGPVTMEWNWRDLVDNRIYLYRLDVEHPYVHIIQHADGNWNFKELFPPSKAPAAPTVPNQRNLGDYIVMDSVTAKNGTFLLSMPWDPDTMLHGAARDSAIRAALASPAKVVMKTYDGYARLYAWRNGNALISHIRLSDPDSDKFGQEFRIASMSVDEYEPTFKFRNVRGVARRQGDSVFMDIAHFDMPASTGHTPRTGKVWWGSDLPVRYDIAIRGDSVSLDDVNWVYPTLPRSGGGTLDLAIKTDPKNMHVVDFRLQRMDVRSTSSHLTGDMWFGTGAPVLLVRNVDLRADPVTFDLLRTINGKPFPQDWRGNIVGTVKARGGPLTHFYVDDARATFSDAHVRGAVSRGHGRGELDILYPAFTAFHSFKIDDASVDLRTVEYLFPAFPKLAGTVTGAATLDSSWLDVRLSNANIYHRDGPGEPTHLTGGGRVTYGEKFETYDLTLDAEPLNLSMVGRSLFPSLPPLGVVSGPVRVRGQIPDLELATSLQGASGALSFDGRVDLDSIGGYGAHGRGQFSGIDLAKLLDKPGVPAGQLSGHYDIDIAGETAATLHGLADVNVERTTVNGVRVYPARAQVRFADGRMELADTLRIHSDAATLVASGGIGLPKGRPDMLVFDIKIDSLGGLRPIISHPDTTLLGAAATLPDSLSGMVAVVDTLVGTLDALDLRTHVAGNDLYWNRDRGQRLRIDVALHDLLHERVGTVTAHVDSVTLFGVALDTIGGTASLTDSTYAAFTVGALSRTGPTGVVVGNWSRIGALETFHLDSVQMNLDKSRWRLAAPTTIALDTTGGWRVDSLVLRNSDTATISLVANVPQTGAAFARLSAQGVPLGDVRTLAQISDSLSGVLNVGVTVGGTKMQPRIQATALASSIRWAGLGIDSVSANANYANGRAQMAASLVRDGKPTVSGDASVPVAISLIGFKKRSDSLQVNVQAVPTDLSILKPLVGSKIGLAGQIGGAVQVRGTLLSPTYNGNVSLHNASVAVAALGVTFDSINGTLTGGVNAQNQDSVNVQLTASTLTGTRNRDVGRVNLNGWARDLDPRKRRTAFYFRVIADSLHAFRKPTVADLTISTRDDRDRLDSLVLSGTFGTPVLRGPLTIDRGLFYLMDRDLARKQGVTGAEFVIDTAATTITLGSSELMQEFENNLQISGVPIRLGRDVRLRSTEANVLLTGDLTLTKSNSLAARGEQIEGTLFTVSGTYNLKLGLVQREFQVLPGGTVTFDGPPTTPRLNIRAQYNVPQVRDRPLGVIVTLSDRMPNPKLSFSSNATYDISQSDLLSYLLTGRPGFAYTNETNASGADLAALLSPTVGVWASEGLRRALPFFDVLQLQLGAGNSSDIATNGVFSRQGLQSYITAATVDIGRQLTNKLFVAGTVNFCQLSAASNYGARLEYRFQPTITLQASYDPPPLAGTCGQQIVSLVQQPSQASFSLLQTWRF